LNQSLGVLFISASKLFNFRKRNSAQTSYKSYLKKCNIKDNFRDFKKFLVLIRLEAWEEKDSFKNFVTKKENQC
jgi:hypothetical protein